MRLHMAFVGYGSLRLLRHFGHTPALYAYRGLSASGFALPWWTAIALDLEVLSVNYMRYHEAQH